MKIEAIQGKIEATRESSMRTVGPTFADIKNSSPTSPTNATDMTLLGPDLNRDFVQLQQKIGQGKTFSPQELIVYQIKANQFGLRVELVSKVAETAVSAIKHLQNPQ